MKFDLEIPSFLSHLKVDERGYPIPFFVAYPDGKPDFRLLDMKKQKYCIDQHKCAICGKKLIKGVYWFISGPQGAKNEISSDPPMHEECARFSLQACPHIQYEKADRRDKGLESIEHMPWHELNKTAVTMLILADKYKTIPHPGKTGGVLIKYHRKKLIAHIYQNGFLTEVK